MKTVFKFLFLALATFVFFYTAPPTLAVGVGESCSIEVQCDAGLVCNGIVCIPLEQGGVGEHCRNTEPRCDDDLVCSESNFCHYPDSLGPCEPSSQPGNTCRAGLSICQVNTGLCCITQDQCLSVEGNEGDPCGQNYNCGCGLSCVNNKCVSNGSSASCGNPDYVCPDGKSIKTAIGCAPIENSNEFIAFFIRRAMGVIGGVAIILMIVASFQIITSQGDKYKLQSGRDMFTAAAAGLLMAIFAVLALQIFGQQILKIF